MNRATGRKTVHSSQAAARRPRRAAAAAVTAVISAAVLAGCGHQIAGSRSELTVTAAATAVAFSANSGCVQAMPVVERALGVLRQLRRHAVTGADARRPLVAELAGLGRLVRATSDTVLQENLAEAADAFAAFRSVMLDRHAPAYQGTFANLAGTLTGFRRLCSVGNSGFETGTGGWAAVNGNTALSRSTTARDGYWSLQVRNVAMSPAAAGFTDSPPWVSTTLKGSEQISLWARALSGAPRLTLQVRELSGAVVVGSRQVTMRLGSTFRFENLTYQIRRPGASRLSVTVSAAGLASGKAFLVDDITIVRD
jgi:hypothetical protein